MSVTVEPASAVPSKVGVASADDEPFAGEVMTGTEGAPAFTVKVVAAEVAEPPEVVAFTVAECEPNANSVVGVHEK